MCKHHQHLINQGLWGCDLQWDKGNPKIWFYLNCDCERCPERLDKSNWIDFMVVGSETSEEYYNEQT